MSANWDFDRVNYPRNQIQAIDGAGIKVPACVITQLLHDFDHVRHQQFLVNLPKSSDATVAALLRNWVDTRATTLRASVSSSSVSSSKSVAARVVVHTKLFVDQLRFFIVRFQDLFDSAINSSLLYDQITL
jgi:hypothetical protein